MTISSRRVATQRAVALTTLGLCACVSCGSGSGVGAGGGPGAGGAAGAGGVGGAGGEAPVEGCVAIFGGPPLLPDPGEWSTDWHPPEGDTFWADERGVHYAWLANKSGSDQTYLLVTSYDAKTGGFLANRVYDPFPEVAGVAAGLWGAAAAPDGSFAVAIDYWDPSFTGEATDAVVVGNLDGPGDYHLWFPPWTILQRAVFHVGWDGEAFAVHAIENAGSQVHLVRLDRDGEVVTPDTPVALMGDFHESKRLTDAESGRTWIASPGQGGLWLSGHERDGSPLPGTEAEGMVKVVEDGHEACGLGSTVYLGLASRDDNALLAWLSTTSPEMETCIQEASNTSAVGSGIMMHEDGVPAGDRKALAYRGTGWWMGMRHSGGGIHSYHFEAGEMVQREPLVTAESCPKECSDKTRLRYFTTRQHGGALWFGFLDWTWGPVFHIVRVKDGCRYPVYREVALRREP